ncbi:hypothetical protein OUZ56_003268 [Daphnia magna]|uniref:Uncharacterized protein n=1 Tax=Daphnia magna TaxID=35525 RepID=A0ABR0A885_9CRUS|nr:hypothetical protein OUZ56_003268 [Daphnia magna]
MDIPNQELSVRAIQGPTLRDLLPTGPSDDATTGPDAAPQRILPSVQIHQSATLHQFNGHTAIFFLVFGHGLRASREAVCFVMKFSASIPDFDVILLYQQAPTG